jgi:hypothetical protein
MNVLVVDIGGSNIKLWEADRPRSRKIKSDATLSAATMVENVLAKTAHSSFDVVALGIPCRIFRGRPVAEPVNLGKGWVGFDYARAFGKPVRIMNDAALQALGSYRGRRMLFLGLGTAIGTTLIADNTIVSLDAGSLLHESEKEVWQLLSKEGHRRLGLRKWQRLVEEITPRLKKLVLADDLVLGGGLAKKLDPLPEGARRGGNGNAYKGGLRLWHDLPNPARQSDSWRII